MQGGGSCGCTVRTTHRADWAVCTNSGREFWRRGGVSGGAPEGMPRSYVRGYCKHRDTRPAGCHIVYFCGGNSAGRCNHWRKRCRLPACHACGGRQCGDVLRGLCITHKNPFKISSGGQAGRGGICVRSAASSRKTLMQICSAFRAFFTFSRLYPPFSFRPMPSEKGSRTGAGVRLRVHHVCRCGIHGSGGYQHR